MDRTLGLSRDRLRMAQDEIDFILKQKRIYNASKSMLPKIKPPTKATEPTLKNYLKCCTQRRE
jgi:hypothetical protein